MIDLRPPRGQGQHGRHEMFIVTIGDEAMGEILDLHVALRIPFGTQQVAIDGDLAEFIDEQSQAARLATLDQAAQQGRLAGTEETGHDRDRYRRQGRRQGGCDAGHAQPPASAASCACRAGTSWATCG